MYTFKFKAPGMIFWRSRKCKSQYRQGSRLVLCLVDGTFEDVPNVDAVRIKYGQDLIDTHVRLKKEDELEKARQAAKDKEAKDNADVSRVQG